MASVDSVDAKKKFEQEEEPTASASTCSCFFVGLVILSKYYIP